MTADKSVDDRARWGGSTSRSLLADAQQDDQAAWGRLVHLYAPLVAAWCRRLGVAEQDVVDVLQEVFAAVASNLVRFRKERPHDTFRGWLSTITRNKVRDYFRRRADRPAAVGGTEASLRLAQRRMSKRLRGSLTRRRTQRLVKCYSVRWCRFEGSFRSRRGGRFGAWSLRARRRRTWPASWRCSRAQYACASRACYRGCGASWETSTISGFAADPDTAAIRPRNVSNASRRLRYGGGIRVSKRRALEEERLIDDRVVVEVDHAVEVDIAGRPTQVRD